MGARDYRYVVRAVTAGTSLLAAMPVSAQSLAPTRDELTRQQPQTAPPKSTLNVVGGVERSPCPLADPEFADVRVKLTNVQFNNLKGASESEMRRTWAEYAGTDQPVSVICEIRDRAATYLRDKGYLAAAQVPTQRIENGVVKLEMLYARVTTIRARGQTGGAEAKLAGYLSKLTQDEIFDRNRAERYLLLARDIPGYNVQLTLKPAGTAPGELIGEVSVIRQPYSLDAVVQNLAASETGRWGGQLRAQVYGLTGLGDSTFISAYSTSDFKEQQILQAGHSFRPGSEGLTVSGQITYAWTTPSIERKSTDPKIKARTLFATLGIAYPLIRTQSHNLTFGGGMDYVDQKVDFFEPLTRDHLRVAFLRADFDAVDLKSRRPKWKIGGGIELRKGLDILGASDRDDDPPASRDDGRATATVVRASASAEFGLGKALAIAISPRAQYGFDPVLSFEEFTVGNYTVGRGYDPAVIAGDSGVGVAVELRGPRVSPFQRSRFLIQPYVFGDAAWVWNKGDGGVLCGGPSKPDFCNDPQHVKSAGGGLRAALNDRLAIDAAVAVPLEKAGIDHKRGSPRFLLTFTTRLLPWRS
ncbi:MAG: ShlB/FhaC/HecB family hemolysin secretion/activation protein [Sphingomicrobium sp.]